MIGCVFHKSDDNRPIDSWLLTRGSQVCVRIRECIAFEATGRVSVGVSACSDRMMTLLVNPFRDFINLTVNAATGRVDDQLVRVRPAGSIAEVFVSG